MLTLGVMEQCRCFARQVDVSDNTRGSRRCYAMAWIGMREIVRIQSCSDRSSKLFNLYDSEGTIQPPSLLGLKDCEKRRSHGRIPGYLYPRFIASL